MATSRAGRRAIRGVPLTATPTSVRHGASSNVDNLHEVGCFTRQVMTRRPKKAGAEGPGATDRGEDELNR